MIKARKIFVGSSTAETGGPELLHQFVDQLRKQGCDAYVTYLPASDQSTKPARFMHYDAPVSTWQDQADNYILLPENLTGLVTSIKHARVGIWWLSVDNYFGAKHQSWLRDLYVKYKSLLDHRLPLSRLRNIDHFTQSDYAKSFLANHGINAAMLSDFLRDEFLRLDVDYKHKENIIAYNPRKGQKQVALLKRHYPDFNFTPIENMTPDEVAALLIKAKIYVDFGHHPGKDRPPREAAMAGCCVITGRQGSANYFADVPIPDQYKLNDNSKAYVKVFGELSRDIFEHFERHAKNFDAYRAAIKAEPARFIQQVATNFAPGSLPDA